MSAKILIVDDERDLAEVVRARLTAAGYRCAVLGDPERALDIVRSKRPDLVITDVIMPKVSGYELCRKIRMDPIVYATPVLMLSAMSEAPEIAHAYEQGANDYLVKPFDLGVLFQKVKDLLAQRQQLEAKNSLTGLPGKEYLQHVVTNKVFRGDKVAVFHLSFAHSGGYADAYGPERRDAAITTVADMISEVATRIEALEVYAAHLGRFDFLVCCNAVDGRRFAEALAKRFEHLRTTLYDKADLDRGYLIGKGGELPLMHVVIGLISNESLNLSAARMTKIAMELNKRAQHNGSTKIITAADALIV